MNPYRTPIDPYESLWIHAPGLHEAHRDLDLHHAGGIGGLRCKLICHVDDNGLGGAGPSVEEEEVNCLKIGNEGPPGDKNYKNSGSTRRAATKTT